MSSEAAPMPDDQQESSDVEPLVRFIGVFAEYFDLSVSVLSPGTRLVDDLGFDSLMYAEVEYLFYETAAHDVPDDLIASLVTVGDVYHYWWTFFTDPANQSGQGTR